MRPVIFAAICGLLLFDLSSCAGGHGNSGGGGGGSSSGIGVGNTGVIVGSTGAGISTTIHPFTGSTKKK
jgi:hypothetical protein